MKTSHSFGEVHGPGKNLAGVQSKAQSAHATATGSMSPSDERTDIRSANRHATSADQNYQMQSMINGTEMTTEGHLRARNSGYYNAAQEGSESGSRQLRDTDDVIASARGDMPGTEYTTNGASDDKPMAIGGGGKKRNF